MWTKVVKVGNSAGVRIPAKVLFAAGLQEGDRLWADGSDGRIALTRDHLHPKVEALMGVIGPMLGRKVLLVYLFGSSTTARWNPGRSDIDVYIIVRDEEAQVEVVRRVVRLDAKGPPSIDATVVPLAKVDWGWFEVEVHPGVPLYVDRSAFPEGVGPRMASWDWRSAT